MKRTAEKQMTKDDDEDDLEYEGQVGMKKADDTVLATRKIRALPKRSGASVPNSPSSESTSPSKFAGFSGFGTGAGGSFQFAPPALPSPFSSPSPAKPSSTISGSALEPQPSFKSTSLSTEPTLPDISGDGDAAIEYYKSLRGLNTSILSAITKALERDPFSDVSFLLERYKSFRGNVQKDFDEKSKTGNKSSSTASLATASAGSFTMPTPPSSFLGFGDKVVPSSSSAAPATSVFTPKLDATTKPSSPFSFPPAGSSSSGAFSFPSAGSKPSESTSESSTTTSLFGSSAPVSTSSAFTFTSPPSSGSTSNLFGASSTSTPFGTAGTTSKFGGFGGFGGAGKASPPAGSIGNPVGFGFGSPSKSENAVTSGFPFAKDSSTSSTATKMEEELEEGAATQETQPEGTDGSALILGNNPHDEEGEGEEGEETLHSIRSKAFRMKKAGEGEAGWADLGTGVLRVKKHKETGQRRLLLRNSSTGKIIINFNIYAGLKPTQNKKTLMFVGHEDGTSQTYNVRTKTEEQTSELKRVLDREITFVKAKLGD